MDVDSTGGAVTGAVLAAAVEKPAGKAGEHSHHCDDCGRQHRARHRPACRIHVHSRLQLPRREC